MSRSTKTDTNAIVDLTETGSPEAIVLSPIDFAPQARRSVTLTTSNAKTNRKDSRRGNRSDVVDLVDDSDSDDEISMIPGFCTPFRRKARKVYKVDPNESPLLHDQIEQRIVGDLNAIDDVVAIKTVAAPNPVMQILDVFPDAEVSAVQNLLNQRANNVPAVIEYMTEHKYQKASNTGTSALRLTVSEGAAWMHDYTSIDSFNPTYQYITQATDLLLCDFPFLSKSGAQSCMAKCKNHYALCHKMIFDAVKGKGDETTQYIRVIETLQNKPLKEDYKQQIFSALNFCKSPTTKTPVKRPKVLVSDKILENERKYVRSKFLEWMNTQKDRQDREFNKKYSQQNGTAIECSCCFDSFPIQDMVSCNNAGHLFCLDCIKSFTENLIFGGGNLGVDNETKKLAIELKCFHGDGCNSGFARSFLQKALPAKSLEKYDEVQCEINIKLAGLTDMCSCPKCGFQADVPTGQKIFECPAATCNYASCRECGEAAHIPLRYVVVLRLLPK
jgi:hypothetical protein